MATSGHLLANATAVALREIPSLSFEEFARELERDVEEGAHLSALFGNPSGAKLRLFAVLARAASSELRLVATEVDESFPSLTPRLPQAHLFEREILEQWSVVPEAHPHPEPLRARSQERFRAFQGEEAHEVGVGPVHAGVIEPGHFRFQCHGEQVLELQIALGYQHRGVEGALAKGPNARTLHYAETLSGDATIGHATACCEAFEALAEGRVPARAQALRGVALELERLANHAGDLGALAGDVGFLPTAAFCGRLRGDLLNLTAQLCGSRFGRGMVRPFCVGFDVDAARASEMCARLDAAMKDLTSAVELLWNSPSVLARFEETGAITAAQAIRLGLVGPVARACGLERDVRSDFPTGIWRFAHIPTSTASSGDVFARAYVRWLEIQRSATFVREALESLPAGPIRGERTRPRPHHVAVSLVEGWRGEICHVVLTDAEGRFARYKVVDPSFHNWSGLELALRNQQISDFPLCNKSFNLSYCGHDL